VDAFHSRDKERLPEILPMLDDLGCNMVRCWGGNVYENEIFYDYCDENGILVWQDFAMGCAIYPQRPEFAARLATEAEAVVRSLRQHASIALWAGDNECDLTIMGWTGIRRDPNKNLLTRQVIPDVLRMSDPTRPYLPSSPYVDEEAFRTRKPTSEEHAWGPRDYFKGKYYSNVVAHFVSETGYHGCPLPASVDRFITPDHRWDWKGENGEGNDPEWHVHAACMNLDPSFGYAYRIPLMAKQVETLFGANPDNLEDFALQSQISQAEAKKFFIERFRLRKWRHTGVLWWNLIDGWPQFSDAIVDYYYGKKLAYYYIRRSQKTVCLMFDEPKDGKIALYAVNDGRDAVALTYRVRNLSTGAEVLSGSVEAASDASVKAESLPVAEGEQSFLLIEWSYTQNGETVTGKNHFMTGMPKIDYAAYVRAMREAGFLGEGMFDYE
jgi:beta-mannosidase